MSSVEGLLCLIMLFGSLPPLRGKEEGFQALIRAHLRSERIHRLVKTVPLLVVRMAKPFHVEPFFPVVVTVVSLDLQRPALLARLLLYCAVAYCSSGRALSVLAPPVPLVVTITLLSFFCLASGFRLQKVPTALFEFLAPILREPPVQLFTYTATNDCKLTKCHEQKEETNTRSDQKARKDWRQGFAETVGNTVMTGAPFRNSSSHPARSCPWML